MNIDHNHAPLDAAQSVLSFAQLGLNTELQSSAAQAGFTVPTPVQAQAIGPVLNGRDVLAQAQTGSGKTAAYVLPVLQLLMATAASRDEAPKKRTTQVLVLVPTRELATQVSDVLRDLAAKIRMRSNAPHEGPARASCAGPFDAVVGPLAERNEG